METFVLIYVVFSSYGAGADSVEFGGKAACGRAGEALTQAAEGPLRSVYYVCVQQNGIGEDE